MTNKKVGQFWQKSLWLHAPPILHCHGGNALISSSRDIALKKIPENENWMCRQTHSHTQMRRRHRL